MRIPKIYLRDAKDRLPSKIENIELSDMTYLPVETYPDVDFDDIKSVNRYVKSVKSMIRKSREYKRLMGFLKDKMDMNKCLFLPKVKRYRDKHISIEVHHTGLVMEDIIRTVLKKRNDNDESIEATDVSYEVMLLHYKGMISLTSLSATCHELIHEVNSTLFIPIQMCDFGDMNLFVDEYRDYMEKETVQKYDQYKLLSSAIDKLEDVIPSFMNVSIIYFKSKETQGLSIPDYRKLAEILNIEVDIA